MRSLQWYKRGAAYLHPKQDQTAPHHPMGEGDAGVVGKYQAQTVSSPYLFPFLVDDGNKSQDKTIDKMKDTVRLYRNAESRISYHLRKLGAKIGIKGKLTLYVARHSWATAARDNHISISVISEALGHHSVTTTQIYLRSIKSSEVDDANAKILAVL